MGQLIKAVSTARSRLVGILLLITICFTTQPFSVGQAQEWAGGLVVATGAASVWVTPLELDFGPVGVGATSSSQVVTLTNTGTISLTGFAGGSPSDAQFSGFQNCAGGLAPGASCQYTFSFSPAGVGTFSAISKTTTNAGSFTISLRGTGVGAGLTVSPLSLDFGPVPVNSTSSSQVVTIRNTGLATLTGFAGGSPSNPRFTGFQNCAGGVAPGASCQYIFSFTPEVSGALTATSSSSTNAGSFMIHLAGTGETGDPPSSARLWVTPLVLDFGPVGTGATTPSQIVTIKNTGASPLTGFSGGTPPDAQFNIVKNCAASLAPGDSCQYTFNFKPSSPGSFSTTSSTSTNVGSFTITLHGTGAGSGLSASPISLDFGPVPVGFTSAPQVVTIKNTGMATLTNFAGGAPLDPRFNVIQNCDGGLAPGATCEYTFSFKPTALGKFTSTSNISTNAGSLLIQLQGGVAAPTLEKSFTPDSIFAGETATLQLKITNPNESQALTGVAVQDTFPTGMLLASPLTYNTSAGCGEPVFAPEAGAGEIEFSSGTLIGGATCTISVDVTAASVGSYTNTSGAVSSTNAGPGNSATATLNVRQILFLPAVFN